MAGPTVARPAASGCASDLDDVNVPQRIAISEAWRNVAHNPGYGDDDATLMTYQTHGSSSFGLGCDLLYCAPHAIDHRMTRLTSAGKSGIKLVAQHERVRPLRNLGAALSDNGLENIRF